MSLKSAEMTATDTTMDGSAAVDGTDIYSEGSSYSCSNSCPAGQYGDCSAAEGLSSSDPCYINCECLEAALLPCLLPSALTQSCTLGSPLIWRNRWRVPELLSWHLNAGRRGVIIP